MAFKNLNIESIVVVVLAVIILIGLAITGVFSDIIRTPTEVSVDEITLVANTSVTLGVELVQEVSDCINSSAATDTLATTLYAVNSGTRTTDGGIRLNELGGTSWNGTDVNCTVDYLLSNSGSNTGEVFLVALAIFGTFASILVLGIMGIAIIRLFKKNK